MHVSSVASSVSIRPRAIDNLCSGKLYQLMIDGPIQTFDSTNSWKSIVCKATTLIFHHTHCSLRNPINVEFNRSGIRRTDHYRGTITFWRKISWNKFFFSKSCESIDTHSVSLVKFGIMFINSFDIFLKDFEAIFILRGRHKFASILGLPLFIELSGGVSLVVGPESDNRECNNG